MKTPARPPAFAFVSYDDSRDADDAVRGRDGYNFDGYRLRCEFAKGDRRGMQVKSCLSLSSAFPNMHRSNEFPHQIEGGGRDDMGGERRAGAGKVGRRSEYGVTVSNLPQGCSWQDLKDFMRKAGDVIFTDVDKYGDGVVEFSNRDDMEYAIKTMDDKEFKGHNDTTFIRVKATKKDDRDDSRDRGRSKSKSPGGGRSVSRSRSRDRKRSASRSVSRSRSPAKKNGDAVDAPAADVAPKETDEKESPKVRVLYSI